MPACGIAIHLRPIVGIGYHVMEAKAPILHTNKKAGEPGVIAKFGKTSFVPLLH